MRELVDAGGRSRRGRGSRVARLRLDEHDGLAADDAVSAAGERENGGDDNEVELVVVKRGTQLGQIGLAQDEGVLPAAGDGGDGALGASYDARADER